MSDFIEQKIINSSEFYDYINLQLRPLFLSVDEKYKNNNDILKGGFSFGLSFSLNFKKNFKEINCLNDLASELRKHGFIFDKNWDKRVKFINSILR